MSTVTIKRRSTAYHGSKARKARFLEEMRLHRKADRFLRGSTGRMVSLNKEGNEINDDYYYERGRPEEEVAKVVFRGCAIACSVYSIRRIRKEKIDIDNNFYDHGLVSSYLGIDEDLAHAFDFIFERLSEEEAANWPIQFANALRPGSQPVPPTTVFYTTAYDNFVAGRDELLEILRNAKPVVEVR